MDFQRSHSSRGRGLLTMAGKNHSWPSGASWVCSAWWREGILGRNIDIYYRGLTKLRTSQHRATTAGEQAGLATEQVWRALPAWSEAGPVAIASLADQ